MAFGSSSKSRPTQAPNPALAAELMAQELLMMQFLGGGSMDRNNQRLMMEQQQKAAAAASASHSNPRSSRKSRTQSLSVQAMPPTTHVIPASSMPGDAYNPQYGYNPQYAYNPQHDYHRHNYPQHHAYPHNVPLSPHSDHATHAHVQPRRRHYDGSESSSSSSSYYSSTPSPTSSTFDPSADEYYAPQHDHTARKSKGLKGRARAFFGGH